jgi:hypothetical protein
MSDPFSDPGTGGDRLDYATVNGALLLFDVKGVEDGIATVFGEKSAVRADVAVLDGASKGEVFADALIFPLVLQGQLRGKTKVIGRLEQGTAKVGQKPPWRLADASEADKDIGRKYLAYMATQAAVVDESPF